jgi:hypothetical protein
MAKYIVQNCKVTIPWWWTFSGGQLFNSDGYNIIVRDGECDGAGPKLIKREVCTPFTHLIYSPTYQPPRTCLLKSAVVHPVLLRKTKTLLVLM